jgi:UDPglucose 6-dehydrogenase
MLNNANRKKIEDNQILIFGIGYVGLATGLSLSEKNEVHFFDVDEKKINVINAGRSPISEIELSNRIKECSVNIKASTFSKAVILNADYIFLALPTNFDITLNNFDTSIIETVLKQIDDCRPSATIVLKSTVPIGFTSKMQKKYPYLRLVFVPEFLREGISMSDTINPSRLVVGSFDKKNDHLINLLLSVSVNHPPVYLCSSAEAEAIKIFSNTYLASRVAIFNEIDSFCLQNDLDAKSVINGISADPRIGNMYNNPSFGYGGYCLPKDTLQAMASINSSEFSVINSIHESNKNRINILAKEILKKAPKIVGIYKPVMKAGSDNFRESTSIALGKKLSSEGLEVVIYEPIIYKSEHEGMRVISELSEFTINCDLILANRIIDPLFDEKILFTRDIYHVE